MTRVANPVFLHSMWRTGSSYLLSRFAQEPRYMTFYEPFNGEIGSRRLREKAERDYAEKHQQLRHPDSDGGYFGIYDRLDPRSARPLWYFAAPRTTLYDVYNGLSRSGVDLLAACQRLAEAEGKVAVFGFCHSGVQIGSMIGRFGGAHAYLHRNPRHQFISYDPANNDFFMAATALQLLVAASWHEDALALAPALVPFKKRWVPEMVRRAPHWLTMRYGRRIWRSLPIGEMYALFYLSWCISNGRPRRVCGSELSLEEAGINPALRRQFEERFGVSLDGLDYQQPDGSALDVDFAAVEARVQARIGDRC